MRATPLWPEHLLPCLLIPSHPALEFQHVNLGQTCQRRANSCFRQFFHQFQHLTSLQLWPGSKCSNWNQAESPGPMKLMGSVFPPSDGHTVEVEKVVLHDSWGAVSKRGVVDTGGRNMSPSTGPYTWEAVSSGSLLLMMKVTLVVLQWQVLSLSYQLVCGIYSLKSLINMMSWISSPYSIIEWIFEH